MLLILNTTICNVLWIIIESVKIWKSKNNFGNIKKEKFSQ